MAKKSKPIQHMEESGSGAVLPEENVCESLQISSLELLAESLNYLCKIFLKAIYFIFSSDNIRSFMDVLQQSGTHLQQQTKMSY